MLTAIRCADRTKVGAWESEKADAPFECHCCGAGVVLRRGPVMAAHFAHRPPFTCEYGGGESEEHRRCKLEIHEHLAAHPAVARCELERNLGTVRPDVSAYVNGVPVAVEVQLSTLTVDKIRYRTIEYARKNIYLIWLPLHSPAIERDLYRPRPWERWLHAAYFGRVYYWLAGLTVVPVHFRRYYARVRGRTRDYEKLSNLRVPVSGRPLDLARDFRPVRREAAPDLSIPAARLFMEARQRPDRSIQ